MPDDLARLVEDARLNGSAGALVNTAELADDLEATLRRFVVFSDDHQPRALALWTLHTWALDASDVSPYAIITAPEKQAGKTRLRDVLALLVRGAWTIDGAPSEAVLFRKIDRDEPTMLLDEADAIFDGIKERAEALRAIFNSGNQRGATVPRCEGANFDTRDFEIFCAKLFCGIDASRWPDTIRDRSITIELRRKLPSEGVERLLRREAAPLAAALRERCEAWASAERIESLRAARPHLPVELGDRAADGWEPLLAVAEEAGGEWPAWAREAALALSAQEDAAPSLGVRLLSDIGEVFEGPAMFTRELLDALREIEEAPWEYLDARRLADLLRPYGIRPNTLRRGKAVAKGYERPQFSDALARYVGGPYRISPLHPLQPLQANAHGASDVTGVTDVTAKPGPGAAPFLRPNPRKRHD